MVDFYYKLILLRRIIIIIMIRLWRIRQRRTQRMRIRLNIHWAASIRWRKNDKQILELI